MSELISGKEALIALANGQEVQVAINGEWVDISIDQKLSIKLFTTGKDDFGDAVFFRLKPSTITLNGVEVPAPFKPKDGDKVFIPSNFLKQGYMECIYPTFENYVFQFGAWRTEEEIKQVVAALRSIFGEVK